MNLKQKLAEYVHSVDMSEKHVHESDKSIHEMINLRQAAEMALKYFEDAYGLEDEEVAIKEALRQALAKPEMKELTPHELKKCVHEFFTKYLNCVEETDSGRPFNPVTIGCCRALMLEPLNKLLDRMRELSGAKPNPLYEEKKNEG